MRVLFIIGHPAHVHLFKHVIKNLLKKGHEIKVVARDKDCTLELLDAYGIDYELVNIFYESLLKKMYGMIKTDYEVYKIVRRFKPDIMCGVLDPYIAQVGRLTGIPSIIFTDTEDAKIANWLTIPFADVVCTPACFRENFSPRKHIRYNGYHELAYLHPKYFKPNPEVLDDLGVSKDDKIVILRFISWGASHDITLKGIQREVDLVKFLEQYGNVYITSERNLNKKLEKYRLKISPESLHSVLYYADLYMGEGGTTAVEAAILGTPAIHVESKNGVATGELSGNFRELRDKYGLLYFYSDQNQALEKAIDILENKKSKKEWQKKRKKLIEDKIDVTKWITNFIERYPQSFYEYVNRG